MYEFPRYLIGDNITTYFLQLGEKVCAVHDILVSPSFSTFTNLVQLELFSTCRHWAVWRKASAQSSVTSNNTSVGLICSSLVSLGVEIFSGLYNFPGLLANPRDHTLHLCVAREHTSYLSCHQRNLCGTFALL